MNNDIKEEQVLADKKMNMKVLLVGGGGREHAIADAILRSDRVGKLYCAPGNAGIARIAECVPIGTMDFPVLTCVGWIPGVIAAICFNSDKI